MTGPQYKVPGAPAPAAPAAPSPEEMQSIKLSPYGVDTGEQPPAPQPTANEGVHPLVISPEEGLPTVPQEKLLKMLQKVLKLKYTGMILYTNYGDRIRAHFRDAIYDHFKEHMKEERQGAYDITMKITALGGEPTPQVGQVPDTNDLHQMFGHIIMAEKTLIQAERDVLAVCGEYTGLKVLMENMLLLDQKHLDDARRMMLCEGGNSGPVPQAGV